MGRAWEAETEWRRAQQLLEGTWRCLLSLDRMLFGQLYDPREPSQVRSVTDRVAGRLRDCLWGSSVAS